MMTARPEREHDRASANEQTCVRSEPEENGGIERHIPTIRRK